MNAKLKFVAMIGMLALAGCTTAMYEGDLSRDKVARITSVDTYISAVDDKEVHWKGANYAKVLVLPGERKIDVSLNLNSGYTAMYSIVPISVYFDAQEGREYVTQAEFSGDEAWFPIILDKDTSQEVHYFKE
mgnify:CR=1 FL=1